MYSINVSAIVPGSRGDKILRSADRQSTRNWKTIPIGTKCRSNTTRRDTCVSVGAFACGQRRTTTDVRVAPTQLPSLDKLKSIFPGLSRFYSVVSHARGSIHTFLHIYTYDVVKFDYPAAVWMSVRRRSTVTVVVLCLSLIHI